MVVSFKCCTCKKKERKKELNANVKEVVALKKKKQSHKNFIALNQVSTICIEAVFLLLILKNYLLQLNTTISFGMRKSIFSIMVLLFYAFQF